MTGGPNGIKQLTIMMYPSGHGGPASSLSIKSDSPGVSVTMKKGSLSEYEIKFAPVNKDSLPDSWRFSLSYDDRLGKRDERNFEIAPHSEARLGGWETGQLDVFELHE